jgi:hypothetical protein
MFRKDRNIVFWLTGFFFFGIFAGGLFGQISVTSPSSREDVKSCPEYSDEVLLDRWDMNERTDLGWRIYNTYELPLAYLNNITFSGGVFSARSALTPGWNPPVTSDVNITLLDSAYPNAVVLGKNGRTFPINADKYRILVLRMYLEPGVEDMSYGQGYLLWSKNTIYNGQTTSRPFLAKDGWYFYFIDIPSLGIISGSDPWSGTVDSLRLDPIAIDNKEIKIDWVRLVQNDASTQKTIRWSGAASNVDIYLDNDRSAATGNLGKLAKNVSGTSYGLLAGALAAGEYYIAVTPTGADAATSSAYSAGYYHVNDTPIIQITRPSNEGSDVDFATASFSDPWDMANTADVESTVHIRNARFQTINYEDLVGQTYSDQTVFYGEADPASPYGDPYAYLLFPWYDKRGTTTSIDTNKYHNLTFKLGISGTYSYNDGSIARVVWKREDESVENVCRDIVIKHFSDRWLMNKTVVDLKTIPLEDGAGSPSHSGWTGLVNAFRIDPHEFGDGRGFFLDDVRLTADLTVNASVTLDWTLADTGSGLQVSLYRDTDSSGFNGVPIATNLVTSPGVGHYTWNTTSVPSGKYWVYATVTDGVNANSAYSTGPLIINHNDMPEISLSKNALIFGGTQGGVATQNEKVLVTNRGLGMLNWQATKNASWLTVSPTSWIGDGALTVGIDNSGLGPGSFSGVVTVTDPAASNSPQRITVNLTIYAAGGDGFPFGVFETPVSGSRVYGNISVTGWALDDIEVKKVEIKRAPDVDDSPSVIDYEGLVYIGDACFVRGARPDVQNLYPTYPRSDCAGWGYMLLSYFLPRGGNGNFRLIAVAVDSSGRRVRLGEKDIVCENASSVKPFGTIDTPAQGGTASGNAYVNFGWALTPPPKEIPRDGSTMNVWVDSVPVGKPVYDQYRQDIYDLFPTCRNRDGAVGYYYLDTTKLTNGVHSIAWSVVDNAGEAQGIGSRYFEVTNVGGTPAALPLAGFFVEDNSGVMRVEVRGEREIEAEELDYVEIKLEASGGGKLVGWGEDKTKTLPVGSTLDEEKGMFHWLIGPGFLGRHVLHFAVRDGHFVSPAAEVVVNIRPKRFFPDEQKHESQPERQSRRK